MSQPSPATVPTTNPVQSVKDPYGSGNTFTWGTGERIPKPGDSDYLQYSQALGNWLHERDVAYRQTPQYQQDQAASNPAIASGQVPAIGFRAEAPNAWGIPVGSTVTALEKQAADGGYQIGYTQPTTPQRVHVEGPGYAFEGTVQAVNAQDAYARAISGSYVQIAGVDVSPNKLGARISESGVNINPNTGGYEKIQVGDPEQNAYWVKKGLPQYAAYTPPSLSENETSQGFYIKDISADGTAPKVTVANSQYEAYWSSQGHPELSNYQPPTLQSNQYIYNPKVEANGQLTYSIGNTEWEKQWQQLGVTDVGSIRGYAPPTDLPSGSYVTDITPDSGGLKFQVGNKNWEQQWANLGVTDVSVVRGYQAPSDLPAGSYATVSKTDKGLSYQIGNTAWEQQWKDLGVTDLSIVKGYSPPTDLTQGSYINSISKTDQGLSYSVGNKNWESQWSNLGVTDVNTIRGYAPPSDLPQGGYISNISKNDQGLTYSIGNRISEAKLSDINNQLSTINQQNERFTQAYNLGVQHPELIGKPNSGAISLSSYQTALAKQNQNTIGLFNEAESAGFLSSSEKQANINQLNTNLQSVNQLANNILTSQKPQTGTQIFSAGPSPAIAPLGVDPQSDIARIATTDKQGIGQTLLVRSDYKVDKTQTLDTKTYFTIVPKNQPIQQQAITNDVFTGKNINFAGQQPLIKNNEQRLTAIGAITAVIATPIMGAGAAIKAAITGIGVSQGIKTGAYALQGQPITQSLLTPNEAVEAASGGVIFAGIGGAANTVLKITGGGLTNAGARVATSGIIGAGGGTVSEYVQTGQVTGVGTLEGTSFGLAFGVAGEGAKSVDAKFGVSDKVKTIFTQSKDSIITPIQGGYGNKIVASEVKTEPVTTNSENPSPEIKGNKLNPTIQTPSQNIMTNSNRGEFITTISSGKGKGGVDYLIKQPNLKNLEISKSVQIRNPNTFNPDEANARIDLLTNQIPSRGNYDDYSNVMMKGGKTMVATKGGKVKTVDAQLSEIEQLSNEPLPRSVTSDSVSIEEINAKIAQHSFDAKTTNAKIDAQLKQANAFDVERVDANIAKALREAELEKATSGQFTTSIETTESPTAKINNYLITQPTMSNLTISERLNIRNPNTFDPTEANDKTNALIKETSFKTNYGNYRSIMSQGQTLTATKTKTIYDTQLDNIEQLSNQPLPRTTNSGNDRLMSQPLPNSLSASSTINAVGIGSSSDLIPKVNVNNVKQSVNQRMQTQLAGIDYLTANRLAQRVMPISASETSAKINVQLSGGNKSATAQDQFLGQYSKLGLGQSSGLSSSQSQGASQKQMVALSTSIAQAQLQDVMIDQMQDVTQKQSLTLSYKTSTGLRQSASELNTSAWTINRQASKKGVKSIPFVNPILTGFQLLGKRESGDEQPFF